MSAIMDAAFETYRLMREDFELYRHGMLLRAHTELCGELLNAHGRAGRIDPYCLFIGPSSRVELYASEELKGWFEQHGRTTVEEFETQWFAGHSAIPPGPVCRSWRPPPDASGKDLAGGAFVRGVAPTGYITRM